MDALEARYAQGRLFPFAPAASVEIDAPIDLVWKVLTDFPAYREWNRFTPSVECSGELGAPVVMEVCFPGAKPMRQVEILNVFEAPRRLAWGMHLVAAPLLVANRYQLLEALGPARTRYATVDYLSGLLAPLVRRLYEEPMRAGFALAAAGLKERCESFAAALPSSGAEGMVVARIRTRGRSARIAAPSTRSVGTEETMKPPPGMLSLTYHLAYDPYYRDLWNNHGAYEQCFSDFSITDEELKAKIETINDGLGTPDKTERNALIDQWLVLVGDFIKAGADNPRILW